MSTAKMFQVVFLGDEIKHILILNLFYFFSMYEYRSSGHGYSHNATFKKTQKIKLCVRLIDLPKTIQNQLFK